MKKSNIGCSITLIILAMLMSSCATTPQDKPSLEQKKANLNMQVDKQIIHSAGEIQQQLNMMLTIEKARMGKVDIPLKTINGQYADALNQTVDISWYGAVEPLVRDIAQKANFELQVYGKKPNVAILVSVGSTGAMQQNKLIDILRNIDVQMKSQARLYVDAEHGVLSLRYS